MSSGSSVFAPFEGSWSGRSTLWLEPGSEGRPSSTTLHSQAVVRGKFLRLDYTWTFEGDPQAGSLLLGYDAKAQRYEAAWIDSWHMGSKIMHCSGEPGGGPDLRGEYEVGDGSPNWGWRIALASNDEGVTLRMWNVTPQGQEALAAEAIYTPVGAV